MAWGRNIEGQSNVPALTGVIAIAAGFEHSLALSATSTVFVAGFTPPAGLIRVRAVAAGAHSMALKSDGTVVAWGINNSGQTDVPALTGITAIAAGNQHSVALKSDGTVAAWGRNDWGQATVPADLDHVVAIAAGNEHSLALRSDGTVVAWGHSDGGQSIVPAGLRNVIAIAAGAIFSVALRADGTVVAWGAGTAAAYTAPDGLDGVKAIKAGSGTTLALKCDGSVVGWGSNTDGQGEVPPDLPRVRAVSCGVACSLVLLADGTITGWGNPANGVLPKMSGVRASAVDVGNPNALALTPNAAPVLTSLPAEIVTREDTSSGSCSFLVADDGGSSLVTFSATSSVPSLIQSITFGGTGSLRSVTVIPAPNANGTATLTLTANDGFTTNSATIPLTVTAVNDAPSFTAGGNQTVNEDAGPQSILGWATHLQPGPTSDEFTQNLTFLLTGNTNAGLFSAAPAVNGTTGELTYTPAPNQYGQATITLRLRDDGGTANGGQNTSAVQTFTIQVTSVNDAPAASDQSATTAEDTAKPLTLSATDVDGDPLNYNIVIPPAHGTLTGAGASRTYTPAPDYHGADSFTFKANDGTDDSNTATVSLTVTSVNDLPVALGESYATPRGTVIEIAAPGVLGNDTDVDGDSLTARLVTSVSGGTLALNADGSYRYTPSIDFSGTDTFTYRAHDGTAAGNTVTVILEVSATPPASTPNAQVEATGTIPVAGGNATFTLSARKSSGRVVGSLSYLDPVRTRNLTSTELTSVVVIGRKARVFGKGKLANGTIVDFVVDVEDVAEPGRNKDRFQLEYNGQTTGAVLNTGNVTVRP